MDIFIYHIVLVCLQCCFTFFHFSLTSVSWSSRKKVDSFNQYHERKNYFTGIKKQTSKRNIPVILFQKRGYFYMNFLTYWHSPLFLNPNYVIVLQQPVAQLMMQQKRRVPTCWVKTRAVSCSKPACCSPHLALHLLLHILLLQTHRSILFAADQRLSTCHHFSWAQFDTF